MKNVNRVLALVFTVALTVASSTYSFANEGNKNTPTIELKFLGNADNQPIFQLSLTSAEADEYTITIRDEAGYVLYSSVEKSRKFRLSTETLGNNPVTVEIKSKNSKKTEVYEIGRTQKVVTETVVNKIN
jgi:hypothetical protein